MSANPEFATAQAAVSPSVAHFLAEHARVSAGLAGAGEAWLTTLRQEALVRFSRLGFPTQRDENWKYTRVTPIEKT